MATIGTLAIAVKADTSQFTKSLKDATKTLDSFIDSAAQSAKKIAILGAGLVVTGITALAVMTRKTMNSVEAMTRFADSIGISIESLRGFEFAANKVGVSTAGLRLALEKMVLKISEASIGSKKVKEDLEELGISVKDIVRLDPEDQFKLIADAMKGLGAQSDRARLSVALFGTQGTRLLSIFKEGAAGLEKAEKQVVKLAGSLNRVEAEQIIQANIQIKELNKQSKALGLILSKKVAPFLTFAVKKLVEMGKEGVVMGVNVSAAFELMLRSVAKIIEFFDLLRSGWLKFQGTIQSGIASVLESLDDLLFGFEQLALAFGKDITAITGAIKDQADLLRKAGEKSKEESKDLLDSFVRGKRSKQVLDFFRKIRADAERVAIEAVKASDAYTKGRELGERKGGAQLSKDIGQFRKVNLSRIAVAGFTRPRIFKQKVEDGQLKRTNELLAKIEKKFGITPLVAQ